MEKVLDSDRCDIGSMAYWKRPQEILPSFQSLRLRTCKHILKVLKEMNRKLSSCI